MTETQERFLRTVLTRVPLDSVVELHLFPALRRGTLETGVAVIATVLPPVALAVDNDADSDVDNDVDIDADNDNDVDSINDNRAASINDNDSRDDADTDDSPYTDDVVRVIASPRLRILTASYRHTIKGVERGAFSVDVQVEADAPLDAVEAVLRGVRHRSTEPADPEAISHDTLASLLTPSAVAPAA
jgi:hypothetical protein